MTILEQAPSPLQVTIKVPNQLASGRVYYNNLRVSKDIAIQIIELAEQSKQKLDKNKVNPIIEIEKRKSGIVDESPVIKDNENKVATLKKTKKVSLKTNENQKDK